jgi:hypothetical protein
MILYSPKDKGESVIENAAAGKSRIINLMSVDVNDIMEMSIAMIYIYSGTFFPNRVHLNPFL